MVQYERRTNGDRASNKQSQRRPDGVWLLDNVAVVASSSEHSEVQTVPQIRSGHRKERGPQMTFHSCNHIGSQLGETTVKFSWREFKFVATKPITHVFGAEVNGQLHGSGITRKRALRALEAAERNHYEALWI